MKHYSSESAREIYVALKKDSSPEFPITAKIVNGIIEDFVYGDYESGTGYETSVVLSVPGKKLLGETWNEVQTSVQEIFDTAQKEQIAA